MTFEEAKLYKQKLEDKNNIDGQKLKEFDSEKNEIGLTPDHVKALPEWILAKRNFEASFAQLREFNGWYVKKFKKEMAAERRRRYLKIG